MRELEIKCVKRTHSYNAYARISAIGGLNEDGSPWSLSSHDAIAGIRSGTWRFWTADGRKKTWLSVALSSGGQEYLKSEPDQVQPTTLLSLPEFVSNVVLAEQNAS